jgi:hypothetical protein
MDNPTEALLLEQAQAMIRDLMATADRAEDGQVLHQIETFLLTRGRDFLCRAFEATAQAQAGAAEKKGSRPARVPVATAATTRGGRRGNC